MVGKRKVTKRQKNETVLCKNNYHYYAAKSEYILIPRVISWNQNSKNYLTLTKSILIL